MKASVHAQFWYLTSTEVLGRTEFRLRKMSVNAREISNTKRDKVLDMLVICLGKLDLSLLY